MIKRILTILLPDDVIGRGIVAALWLLLVALIMLKCTGCESIEAYRHAKELLDDDDVAELVDAVTDEPDTPAEPIPEQADFDLSQVQWLGQNYSGAAESLTMHSASRAGSMLNTSYDAYSWPVKTVGGVDCDAIACVFYKIDGQWMGGKFDWWRKGGQSSKTMENIWHGYNGHTVPADGAECATMIVSVDGSKRSTLAYFVW